ncbi:aminotransferase class I/II-fold pyridoxal phosphate-dependent enzyme [Microbacterium sediminicola]|uniref:cysteine-S-conjugate beta-lyase n=1 Tax=Microbacterium sediminicola TaxID=415210 RepID=A0ABN2HV76_9MICO
MTVPPLEALPIEELRRRSSTKWRAFPDDVLPLFVAETDFPLAPAITERLRTAVELGDTGYTPPEPGLRAAYSGFAERRFGWQIEQSGIRSTGDVIMGVVELLRHTISPGDRVLITPPVYPPFYDCIPEAGGEVETVPLVETEEGWSLDLLGIEAAFAGGARAMLLCNPHNPTGTVHSRETLAELADIAAGFGAVIISDEIHAPLVHAPTVFTPFLSASKVAAAVGYAVTSASKAYNLAGLKCALMLTASPETTEVVKAMPAEVEWRTGLFGALAGVAAFDPQSDDWLDAMKATLDQNRRLLADLLATHLPKARYRIPDAGYLAWIDLSACGWGDDPADKILRETKVALHHGSAFGEGGSGYVRLNFGCSPEVLTEAITRIGALAG